MSQPDSRGLPGPGRTPGAESRPWPPDGRPRTPGQAWTALAAGNARFVAGKHSHPNQDAARRHSLSTGQTPIALFFGCADSRVAAEIIFDQGLGDLFVVRTAGHVVDSAVLGSLEFGVGVLEIPLIVVLGHDSCGAVAATMKAVETGDIPGGFIRDIVERVTPSVLQAQRLGLKGADAVEAQHVRNTIDLLMERSRLLSLRVDYSRLGIVGATYDLADGRARIVHTTGAVLTPGPADGAGEGAADVVADGAAEDAAGGATDAVRVTPPVS